MGSLFSTFDPASWAGLGLNWTIAPLALLLLPPMYWSRAPQITTIARQGKSTLLNEFRSILSTPQTSWILLIPISLFSLILCINSVGLLPHVFTASSSLALTASLALSLWLGHMFLAASNNPLPVLAHLLPIGTPPALYPFMVFIEIISNCIRPITLAVRLAANMLAGHLLLSILSGNTPILSWMLSNMVLTSLVLLCVLETAVSVIQAYVFSALSSLYFSEVNAPQLS